MHPIFTIYPSVYGHIGSFQSLAIMLLAIEKYEDGGPSVSVVR